MSAGKQSNRRKYFPHIIAIVIIVVVGMIVLVNQSSQPVGRIFTDIMNVTCGYRFKVVAFSDANGDGLQDTGEAGVAGVAVSLQHSKPPDKTPEQKVTDASGVAEIAAEKYCPEDDKITVNTVPPEGYRSTTSVHFGPYPVPEMTYDSYTQVALEPIPEIIYVGLQKT